MKDRIVTFIENERITPAEFADQIGIQRSSLSHVLNGRNNPGFSFIQKILTTFPQINSRWLITGEGNMLNADIETEKPKLNQPSLFDAQITDQSIVSETPKKPEPTPIQTPIQIEAPQKQPAFQNEESSVKTVDKVALPIAQIAEKQNIKSIKRVLIFYDDHTFDDYRPSE
jgi:transcriptional regulator with XRE-family HTH domain